MTKTILSIFKEYIKRYKIFNVYSIYALFQLIILFIISIPIKIFNLDFLENIIGYFFAIRLFIPFMIFINLECGKTLNLILLALMSIMVVYSIGVLLLKKIINTMIERDRLKYKVICYLILFVVFFTLKFIDVLFYEYVTNHHNFM